MPLEELNVSEVVKIKPLVDNKSIIYQENDPTSDGKSKHIYRKYHFLKDQADKEKLKIEYCNIEIELVYILMKPLKKSRFKAIKRLTGMKILVDPN